MALSLSFIGQYGVDFPYHNFYRLHIYNGDERSNVQIGSHVSRATAHAPNAKPSRVITVDVDKLTSLPDDPTLNDYIEHAYAYLIHRELKGAEPVLEEGQSLPEGFLEWYAVPEVEANEDNEDIPNEDGE